MKFQVRLELFIRKDSGETYTHNFDVDLCGDFTADQVLDASEALKQVTRSWYYAKRTLNAEDSWVPTKGEKDTTSNG